MYIYIHIWALDARGRGFDSHLTPYQSMIFYAQYNQGAIAQLEERALCKCEAPGSKPGRGFDPHIVQKKYICTIGAVGSALVLCTEGPGFEPLMVHHSLYFIVSIYSICRISLVGQDSWLSPGRHQF